MDQDDRAPQDDWFLRSLLGSQSNIYAFILALVHDQNDADDIMQETVIVMWRKFDTFEPGTNFSAWAMAIARREAMKFNKKHRSSRLQFKQNIIEAIDSCAMAELDKMGRFEAALKSCVEKLSKHHRQLVRMRYEQMIPAKKIVDMVGLPIHTFYRTMARIHRSLGICIRRTLAKEEFA